MTFAIPQHAEVSTGPGVFHLSQFASLSAALTAVNAVGWCVLKIPPGALTVSPMSITAQGVTIDAAGAQLTLAAGSNTHMLTVGPDAMNFNMIGGRLDANGTNQTGTCHGVYFEPYVGAFRVADRSNLERVEILNAKNDGLHLGSKRVEVQAMHVSIRDFGDRGVYFGGTDCTFDHGAIGIGDTCVYMDNFANWVRNSGLYTATTTAVRVTENGRYSYITGNSIDNNNGRGLTLQGSGGSTTLDTTVVGNIFRANSTTSDGTVPDIYIKDARAVVLAGNITAAQTGKTKTTYAIETSTGVTDIFDQGNRWEPIAHTVGVYSDSTAIKQAVHGRVDTIPVGSTDNALTVRVGAETVDRFRIRGDGVFQWGTGSTTTDVNLYRGAADTLKTDDFMIAQRFSVSGTAGAGYVQYEAEQSSDPAAPSANGAKVFIKDNGAGKTQLAVRFASGATQILATEP